VNDIETTSTYIPTGHPVRNMTIAILAIAGAFLAMWWSGVVHPRLQLTTVREALEGGVLESTIEIENEGSLPIEVVDVVLPPGTELLDADDDLRIGGGSTEAMTIRYRLVECEGVLNAISLHVRTASGITRSTDETVYFASPGMLGFPPCTPN
jgi:hypothetical protein